MSDRDETVRPRRLRRWPPATGPRRTIAEEKGLDHGPELRELKRVILSGQDRSAAEKDEGTVDNGEEGQKDRSDAGKARQDVLPRMLKHRSG